MAEAVKRKEIAGKKGKRLKSGKKGKRRKSGKKVNMSFQTLQLAQLQLYILTDKCSTFRLSSIPNSLFFVFIRIKYLKNNKSCSTSFPGVLGDKMRGESCYTTF